LELAAADIAFGLGDRVLVGRFFLGGRGGRVLEVGREFGEGWGRQEVERRG
jgi:hypothetical protein